MSMQTAFERWRARKWSVKLTVVVVLCSVAGFALSWWINRPQPPWLTFTDIRATYEPGSTVIEVTGTYTATRTCPPTGEPNEADPLEWRQEVTGTQRQPLASYAPQPAPPVLETGTHGFAQEIPLNEGINPDGWSVAVLASCAKEPFAVRSKSVEVEFIEKEVSD